MDDQPTPDPEPETPEPPFKPSDEQLDELEEVLPKPRADYLPDF